MHYIFYELKILIYSIDESNTIRASAKQTVELFSFWIKVKSQKSQHNSWDQVEIKPSSFTVPETSDQSQEKHRGQPGTSSKYKYSQKQSSSNVFTKRQNTLRSVSLFTRENMFCLIVHSSFCLVSASHSHYLPVYDSGCKESTCQCSRIGFDPWVKKIP